MKTNRTGWRDVAWKLAMLALGTMATLLLAEGALRLTGFVFLARQHRANELATDGRSAPAGAHTVLCLGESSTALGGEYAYPRQLEDLLEEYGAGQRFQVVNAAKPGIDSHTIVLDLDENLRRWRPDIVTVMMGINDGTRGFVDLSTYGDPPPYQRLLRSLRIYRLLRFGSASLETRYEQSREREKFAELEVQYLDAIWEKGRSLDYLELGQLYRRQGRYEEAEAILLELASREPSAPCYLDLARIYHDMGLPEEEERIYRVLLADYPRKKRTYRWMRRLLGHQGRDDEIEPLLRTMTAEVPGSFPHVELGKFLWGEGRLAEAEEAYRQAMAMEPNPYAPVDLASLLREVGRHEEAEELLTEALGIRSSRHAWTELGRLYIEVGRRDEAVAALERAIDSQDDEFVRSEFAWDSRQPDPAEAHVELARLMDREGDAEGAQRVLQDIAPNPMTFRNYRELTDRVMASGGRLVIIQYPMRSVDPLRAMVLQRDGIVFVDNEQSFEEAVRRDGFNALFVDHYGGDFGHTSRRGHELVARNTARVILEQYYGLPGPPAGEPIAE